jgi:hypothetical protein
VRWLNLSDSFLQQQPPHLRRRKKKMKPTQKFDLDSTLRFIFRTFRNEKSAMAIGFKHNGRIWRADTVEEATALRQRLEDEDDRLLALGEEVSVVSNTDWTPDAVTDLLTSSGDLQKKFLRYLYEHSNATSTEVVKALKLQSEVAFAGVLSGLSKRLKKTELQPGDLYSVSVQWTNEGKIRRFRLSAGFKWAAEQLGWPETWI